MSVTASGAYGDGLLLEAWSVADLRRQGTLSEIGRAFDADSELRPTYLAVNPTPRRRIASVQAEFTRWEPKLSATKNFMWFFKRSDPPKSDGGMLEVLGPSFGIRPHHLLLDYEADWFDRPERLEALARFAVRVCDAMRAFYGRLGLGVMYTQRNNMLEQSGRDFLLPQLDRELPDVYWLNYFGPGYVEFWDSRLDGLGVRSSETLRGGRLIWATDSPFVFDAGARRVTDYPFKQPFFHRLGIDTFMHETQRPGAVGQLVPGMDVHRRLSD